MNFEETNVRSLVKSTTFRIVVVLTDLVVIYLVTRKVVATIAITILTNVASTILYFLHERVWNGIGWGRRRAYHPRSGKGN